MIRWLAFACVLFALSCDSQSAQGTGTLSFRIANDVIAVVGLVKNGPHWVILHDGGWGSASSAGSSFDAATGVVRHEGHLENARLNIGWSYTSDRGILNVGGKAYDVTKGAILICALGGPEIAVQQLENRLDPKVRWMSSEQARNGIQQIAQSNEALKAFLSKKP